MVNKVIENSSYLDFTAYRIVPFDDKTTVQEAYGLSSAGKAATDAHLNVAIVLERANSADTLLSQDWGTRQAAIADQSKIWATYGADKANYDKVYADIAANPNLTILDSSNSNYVTSQASRTIWVEIDKASDFNALFSSTLMKTDDSNNEFKFWNGDLSLPEEWHVAGLWFDTSNSPTGQPVTKVTPTTLVQGAQSVGNSTANIKTPNYDAPPTIAPNDIGDLYNFPLNGQTVATGTIGLIEPGVGSYLKDDPTGAKFQERLEEYLSFIGQSGTGTVIVQGVNGQSSTSGERSLDVGVVAAVNPNSDIVLYNGSGDNSGKGGTKYAQATVFTAVQSAIWDTVNNPAVTSNSWGDDNSMTPGSPFYEAYWQLFVDAALRNQTTFIALGDGGSGNETSNGVTNVEYNVTQPYNILVGGTSLSTTAAAKADPTLVSSVVASALAGDPATIWQLVQGGLTSMPASASPTQAFVESVWNTYYLDGKDITAAPDAFFSAGYLDNSTGSGGVDPTQPTPSYQVDYGLNPVTTDPLHQTGRGVPDVSANAGGNLQYLTPGANMQPAGYGPDGGTSAASPLWASLGVQLNAIFADQHLPNLGYMNDLLYMASAIAPASFNDVQLGNNISSFFYGGSYTTGGYDVTPTGYGYFAGPGYDLTSGLGSPNGVLLARALTQIAHAQISFSSVPDLLDHDSSSGGWKSGADQTLMFQTMSTAAVAVSVDNDKQSVLDYSSIGGGTFAWTSQFAQQTLQKDFDSELVKTFDQYSQGAVGQSVFDTGDHLTIGINGASTSAIQGNLTTGFGFADFVNANGDVRVARPVAVAETVEARDDQTAIVRIRQNGVDKDAVTFYRVDDFNGTIDGIAPGQAGYAAKAQARAYEFGTGGTSFEGPGYGNYAETTLLHVDANDNIAMFLTNKSSGTTYWAFAQANQQNEAHLWNYGLNTWGWEDRRNGDNDYNDFLVGIDFTSAFGNAYLA